MNTKDIMKYVVLAGGAYLVYWYITKHGPYGPAFDVNGHKIAPSYWDTWFGSGMPAVVATGTGTGAGTGTGTSPASLPPATPPATLTLSEQLDHWAMSATGKTMLSPDQWCWGLNNVVAPGKCPGLSNNVLVALGMNADNSNRTTLAVSSSAFLAQLPNNTFGVSGIGGVIPTATVPQVPSMTFGGGLRFPQTQSRGGAAAFGTPKRWLQ